MELDSLQDNIILVAALAALAGLGIGMLLTYLMIGRGPSKTELTGKLASVEEEFEAHKGNVDKHFATTSALVNELTESYVKVYKHLSEGAEQLGGVADMRHRLTLDVSDDDDANSAKSDSADGTLIEGSLATASAGVAGVVGGTATAQADDPEFTVSDAAVEETLTELEANATGLSDLADADAAEIATEDENAAQAASTKGNR